ncbi:MAG: hypothetical protein H8E66_35160 [Planctomycetes bacterium]|nr:hypothetical protein [Planctomycetota bacterium]
MEALIRQHLRNVERKAGESPADSSKCLVIDKVAPASVAASAGIEPGQLLTAVDGADATSLDFDSFIDPAKTHRYRFFCPTSGMQTELDVSGVPIGVTTEKTTAELERQTKGRAMHDWPLLDPIWKRGEWEVLRRCAHKSQKGSLVARLLGQARNTPATVMHGAALYELGNESEGLQEIREYMSKYEDNWTTQYQAIGRYYVALTMLENGERKSAFDLLLEAFNFSPLDRIADMLQSLAGKRPQEDKRWISKSFPVDYTLPTLDRRKSVSFRDTVANLQRGQILMLCLLANYRANGPYNDFMKRYRHLATQFRGTIAGLHVITMESETNAFAGQWIGAEKTVLGDQLPCELLHDASGEATWPLEPTHSPTILVLGPSGTIVQRAHILDDVALWQAIERSFSAAIC